MDLFILLRLITLAESTAAETDQNEPSAKDQYNSIEDSPLESNHCYWCFWPSNSCGINDIEPLLSRNRIYHKCSE